MSELPDQWIDVPLSEVTDINPPHPDRPIENDQLVSFVPMALVTEESGKLNASQLRPWREVSKGYTRFQEGDILFAKITPCMENGKFALASGLNGGVGAGSTEFHVLRPRTGIRSAYLLNFLFQSDVRRAARMEMKGAAGQLRVPTSFLERLRFPVAPPEEQDRIVAEIEKQFTRLDAATTALKRVQANLKRYRASVLKAACEGRLVPTEAELARKEGRDYEPADKLLERILRERRARWEADSIAKMLDSGKPPKDDSWKRKYKEPSAPDPTFEFLLPKGWCVASMDQLTSRITSGSRDWSAYYGRGEGTFVMAQNVRPGWFDASMRQAVDPPKEDSGVERSRIERGDLLVTIVGANTGDLCMVEHDLANHYVCQSVALMRPVLHSIGPFLEHYMNSEEHGRMIYKKYTYGAGRPHLDFDQLKATPVLLPPEAEIGRLVPLLASNLSSILHQQSGVDRQLVKIPALRNSILSNAFSGKLAPQDPKDEPASALLERIRAERASGANGKPSKRSTKEPAYA